MFAIGYWDVVSRDLICFGKLVEHRAQVPAHNEYMMKEFWL